jgi:hypothetical protein
MADLSEACGPEETAVCHVVEVGEGLQGLDHLAVGQHSHAFSHIE